MLKFHIHTSLSPINKNLLRQMFELRKEIFIDRKGWDIPSYNGMERDVYDISGAIFGVAVIGGIVVGCWRLLPNHRHFRGLCSGRRQHSE